MFWWPKDFTFVCPTEIAEFNGAYEEFRDRNTTLIGASTDSEFVHAAWRRDHDDLARFEISYACRYFKIIGRGIGNPNWQATTRLLIRATFHYRSSEYVIRWVSVYDLSVGRNVEEVIRVLDASANR